MVSQTTNTFATMKILAVIAAAGMGALAGWVCSMVPVWPMVRIVIATGLGAVIGGVSAAALVLITVSRAGSAGIGAVSMGISEVALLGGVVLLSVVAVLGSLVLQRVGWSAASLGTHGPVLAGAGAAAIVAAWLARGTSAGAV